MKENGKRSGVTNVAGYNVRLCRDRVSEKRGVGPGPWSGFIFFKIMLF